MFNLTPAVAAPAQIVRPRFSQRFQCFQRFLLGLLALVWLGAAQAAWADVIKPVEPLGNPGVVRVLGDGNDDGSQYILSDQTFYFYGQAYQGLTVNNNGVVTFGNTGFGSYSNYALPVSGSGTAGVYCLWDDLVQTSTGVTPKGYVYYKVYPDGVAITWVNCPHYANFGGAGNANNTFQIFIYNSSGTNPGDLALGYLDCDGVNVYTVGINKGDGMEFSSLTGVATGTTLYNETPVASISNSRYRFHYTYSSSEGPTNGHYVLGAFRPGPPTTYITSGPLEGSTVCSSSVTFNYTGVDDFTGTEDLVYQYQVDGGPIQGPTSSTTLTLTLADGLHHVTIAAIDGDGNVDPTPPTVDFTVATAPPIISGLSATTSGYAPGTAVVTWTTDKPATSVVDYRVQGTTDWISVTSGTAPATGHSVTLSSLQIGATYEYQVHSADGCGNQADSPIQTFVVPNPVPTLSSLAPTSVPAATTGQTLTLTGTNFVSGVTVTFGAFSGLIPTSGPTAVTGSQTAQQITVNIPDAALTASGNVSVFVVNPAPGGGPSNALTFSITNPTPQISALNPNTAVAGGAGFPLVITGSNFVPGLTVHFGADTLSPVAGTQTATQLTVNIPAGDIANPGTITVTVNNPAPGGGASNALTFTVTSPVPTLSSLSPSAAGAGGPPLTLTLTGTGFNNTSVVQFGGDTLIPTAQTATTLTVTVPTADISAVGPVSVTVVNPAPGGGTSNALTFNVVAVPDLQVTTLTAPATVSNDTGFDVVWTDSNVGAAPANGPWIDRVYFSPDADPSHGVALGDFEYDGALAPNGSARRDQVVSIPRSAVPAGGAGNIIVVTNATHTVDEGPLGNNNARVQPIQVSLLPLPDLQVTSVQFPAAIQGGQTVAVQWQVCNRGTALSTPGSWTDHVYLSSTPDMIGVVADLGTYPNGSALDVGQCYTEQQTVTIPNGTGGTFYVVVDTDSTNQVAESSESNNVGVSGAITVTSNTTLGYLHVQSVTTIPAPPSLIFAGSQVTVNWTVKNTGQSTIEKGGLGYWDDALALSPTPTYDGQTGYFLGGHNGTEYYDTLPVGQTYSHQRVITLPSNISGTWYVVAIPDTHFVAGGPFPIGGSNIPRDQGAAKLVITTPPPAQVAVTAVSAPATATAGQPITVGWTVTNQGAGDAQNGSWTDNIYLSPTSTFNAGTATLIGSVPHSGGLAAGMAYSLSQAFPLSPCVSGTFTVFVVSDTNPQDTVPGGSTLGASNATAIAAVNVPNLTVSGVSAKGPVTAGTALAVTWTVQNTGLVGTGTTSWHDAVYLSKNPTFDGSAQQVDTFGNPRPLAAGASYTQAVEVTVPAGDGGPYYVYVVTDSDNGINQCSGTGDDSARSDQTVQIIAIAGGTGSTSQLTASNVTVPTSATSGGTIPVSWTVTNTGAAATSTGTWTDTIYLSSSPTDVSGATVLGTVAHSGALAVGASYAGSTSVTLPLKTFGPFYIVVVPGYTGASASAPIQLLTYPLSDLAVTSVSAPSGAFAGAQATVSWTVANGGAATTDASGWTDYILLSRDTAPSRSATVVGYLPHTGALAVGGSYNASTTINIPQTLTGPYYVFVYTDWNNAVLESSKYNNFGYADPPMTITLPPPADLVVSSVLAPIQATPGLPTTLTWTVTNQGANAAPGLWTDAVYLSPTPVYSNSATLIGTVTQSGPVAAGASYTGTLTAKIPPVDPGSYYVVVRTDIFNNVLETDKTNNTGVSTTTAALDIPTLTLGTPVSGTLSNDDYRYFKVVVPAGQTLAAVLGGPVMDKVSELYIRYAHLPDRAHYDYFTDTLDPLSTASLSLTVPTTLAGTYDILVRGADEPQPATPFTILAKLVPFSITAVSASHIGDNGQVTLTLHGAKFTAGATVMLIGADGTGIPAALVTVQDGGTARVRFLMQNAAHGLYDLRITNPDGTMASLAQAVTVETATPLQFLPTSTSNLFPRVGSTYTVFGSVKNTSNIDIPYLSVTATVNQAVTMTLNPPADALPALTDDNRAALTQGVSIGGTTGVHFTVRDVGPGEVREFSVSAKGYNGPFEFDIAPVAQTQSDFLLSLQQQTERMRQALLGTPQGAALPEPYKTALQSSDSWYMLFQNADVQIGLLDGPTPPSHAVRLPPPPDAVGDCLYDCKATWVVVTAGIAVALAACIAGTAAAGTPICLFAAAGAEAIADEELVRCACICYRNNNTSCGSFSSVCGVLANYPCPQTPHDPNEMIGPAGFGAAHAVSAAQPLLYTIDFENQATATASARQIVITNSLDPSLDPRTFRLREIRFGSTVIAVPANKSYYQTLVELGPAYNGLDAEVSAGVDVANHQVVWTLVAIDPATGQEVDAANLGLLPPNDAAHDGEGYVSYTISPVAGVANGTQVSNTASIVFDTNEPIATNTYTNTLIVASPTSAVAALPATSPATFLLSWSGSDGVAGLPLTYDIYVSDNGGPYTAALSGVSYTSAPYNGTAGHTYQFYSIAHDPAGDDEPAKTAPDATTMVTGGTVNPVPQITSLTPSSAATGGGDFTLTLTGTGFVNGSTVQWNGQPLTTTYVSGTQLSAIVPAADIATAGSASVTVVSPAPGGGTSDPQIVLIGTPNLIATASLTRDGAEIVAAITVANSGTGPATAAQILSASLGSAATTTTLPVTVGDLGPSQSATVTVRFPAPPVGTHTVLRLSGGYTGGAFGGSQRVVVP